MELSKTWTALKSLITLKGASTQYTESTKEYIVWIIDGADTYTAIIDKDSPATTDQTDFETNFKTNANKKVAIQTTPFSANQVEFHGCGVYGTATKDSTTDLDFLVSEAMLINGGIIFTENAIMGDKFTCQVVDKDGVYAPAGTVLNEWITDWYMNPNAKMDLTTPQAGSIPANVYLRVKYTSTGVTNDVKLVINYKLNKSL